MTFLFLIKKHIIAIKIQTIKKNKIVPFNVNKKMLKYFLAIFIILFK